MGCSVALADDALDIHNWMNLLKTEYLVVSLVADEGNDLVHDKSLADLSDLDSNLVAVAVAVALLRKLLLME